jgi:hypothetical protein
MLFLRQSTAVDIPIGPFLDATDGVTAETALTISQADVRLKKNNGAWAQVNDATAATHEENGWYEKELDATDTNTVGNLIIAVQESGALPVWHEYTVLEEAIYDALFATSANAFSGAAGSTTLTALATGSITAAVIATGAIDADAIAADAITAAKIADGAIDAATFAASAITATVLADDCITAAKLATDCITSSELAASAITEIQAGLSTLTQAQVQTECEEALQAYHLDHLIASADPGGVVANSSFLAKLTSKSATPAFADFDNTTDSLQALRDRGDAAWITATGFSTHSAADVWAAGTRTLTAATNITSTGGTITVSSGRVDVGAVGGTSLSVAVGNNFDTFFQSSGTADTFWTLGNVFSGLTTIDDFLDTEIAAIKAKTDQLTFTTANRVDATVTSTLSTADKESIADYVWDEAISGHLTAGTTGNKLNSAASAGDPLSSSVPGSYAGGTAGYVLGTFGAGTITTTIPVVEDDGTITIVRGDDYKIADSRHFTFAYNSATPDLTGATVRLKVWANDAKSAFITGTCTVTGAGTATQTIKAELDADDTDDLEPGDRQYDVEATLSSGNVVTLMQGIAVVSADVRVES